MPACKRKRADLPDRASAVYVHVPFCVAKCDYCDFYSVPLSGTDSRPGAYVRAVLAELELRRDEIALPLQSVFLGGGTPTALEPELLGRLLGNLAELCDDRTEFSIEANPVTVTPELAGLLAGGGVNRVNLGVQSFADPILQRLGRLHDADQARAAWDLLTCAGTANLGLDLIYGIPGQSRADLADSLDQAIAMGTEHVSCYCLGIEPGTPMAADVRTGLLEPMHDAEQAEQYAQCWGKLTSAGYEHYEISNFARPGLRCRHNLTYWLNDSYLGLGPGAASYIKGVRRTNLPDLGLYLQAVARKEFPPCDQECLSGLPALAESLMLGLRLSEGVDRAQLTRRYGQDPVEAFPETVGRYQNCGAIVVTAERLRLAAGFRFVCDAIFADFLAEADR